MGSVTSLINTTPDGFVDGRYSKIDSEYFDFVHTLLSDTDTVAFGRISFEQFQATWTARMDPNHANEWQFKMARALHEIPKIVFSSTLQQITWHNATIARTVDAEAISAHKGKSKGGLLTFASLSLVATLTEMDLIDDYYFCVQPLIAGQGEARLFNKLRLDTHRLLRFVDSTDLKSGVHIIHYERVSPT